MSIVACKKNDDEPIVASYSVPTTYNFDAVDYSGQTYRLNMLTEMITYCKTANVSGTILSSQKLKDMYYNVNQAFTDSVLNNCGKKLSDKTVSTEVGTMESYFDSISVASLSINSGSNGVTGIIPGTSPRLCSGQGLEYAEMIEKGITGAVFYYQIVSVYLSETKLSTQLPKADRQHHWDEAFGYFGVPNDFPSNVTGIRFIGKYVNARNTLLSCNAKLMNAFLKGRAAINNADETTVQEQITIIKTELERVFAATAISYLNKAKAGILDDNVRNHSMSEGIGFIYALQFNPDKKINQTKIEELLNKFKTNGKYNFYNITATQLEEAKSILSSTFGFDSIKDVL